MLVISSNRREGEWGGGAPLSRASPSQTQAVKLRSLCRDGVCCHVSFYRVCGCFVLRQIKSCPKYKISPTNSSCFISVYRQPTISGPQWQMEWLKLRKAQRERGTFTSPTVAPTAFFFFFFHVCYLIICLVVLTPALKCLTHSLLDIQPSTAVIYSLDLIYVMQKDVFKVF